MYNFPILKKKQKSNGYWTEEIVVIELQQIIKDLGYFPSYSDFRKVNRGDLKSAIDKLGGIIKFRKLLGYELIRKPNGHWSDEKIIIELESLVKKLEHFPTHLDLQELNRNDLIGAIGKHGGINRFRRLMKYEIKHNSPGYWNKENTLIELKLTIKELGYFPTSLELHELNRSDLNSAMRKHDGINHFRELLKYEIKHKPPGYWNEENTFSELKLVIEELGHFPLNFELQNMKRGNLSRAIMINGGFNKFRKLLGYKENRKSRGYWTEETVINELKTIIKKLNHFPTQTELENFKEYGLISGINRKGGYVKFRKLLGYEASYKPDKFWNEKNIIFELELVMKYLDHFPTQKELSEMKRQDLISGITKHGGLNKFRGELGYEPLHKPDGYWTEKTVIAHLEAIVEKLGYFPSHFDLCEINESGLSTSISRNGGFPKFRELMGYPISIQKKYKSEISSYINKRGKASELLVKRIIQDWLAIHNLPEVSCNVKLTSKNILEFVCDIGKTIGIDVTNTESKSSIIRKWSHKDYHKNLDELWIVVFSTKFTEEDYVKLNEKCPGNVTVVSIDEFLKILEYSTDEYLRTKIDKYKECTFRSKKAHLNKSINEYT